MSVKSKKGPLTDSGLTPRQLKFIEAYKGNATDAARKAGYKGNDATLGAVGYENLRKPQIRKAIKKRFDIELEPLIGDRVAMQTLWTKVMHSRKESMAMRLKASELLGKSQAVFIDVQKQAGPIEVQVVTIDEKQLGEQIDDFNKKYK